MFEDPVHICGCMKLSVGLRWYACMHEHVCWSMHIHTDAYENTCGSKRFTGSTKNLTSSRSLTPHTHTTHTHTHTHNHTEHTHTHTVHTLYHTRPHSHTLTRTHTRTHTLSHTHPHSHTPTRTHTPHTHTYTRTAAYIRFSKAPFR